MTNKSIKDAFQRFWEYVLEKVDGTTSEQIEAHNKNNTAHSDIRAAIENLSAGSGGGTDQFVVTFDMAISSPHTVSNQSHTFEEMLAAHNVGKQVIGILHVKYYGDYYYTANFSYDSYTNGGTFTVRLQEGDDMFAVVKVTADNAWSGNRIHFAYSDKTNSRKLYAGASVQTPNEMLIRNSRLVSADTTPANNGETCWTYG